MHTNETLKLRGELQNYGMNSSNIRLFSEPLSPELLDYLDLFETKKPDDQKGVLPDGVAESQGHPLLFFVNESQLSLSPEEKEEVLKEIDKILIKADGLD